jgi:hypothetical protein
VRRTSTVHLDNRPRNSFAIPRHRYRRPRTGSGTRPCSKTPIDTRPAKKRIRSAGSKPAKGFYFRSAKKYPCSRGLYVTRIESLDSTDTGPIKERFLSQKRKKPLSLHLILPCSRLFVEFGGSRIQPITLTEQHVKTLPEHLPELCILLSVTNAKTTYSNCSAVEPPVFSECTKTSDSLLLNLTNYVI